MKAYRKPSGVYIELADTTPVSALLTEVAPRPSPQHVFSQNWATDPMDPTICWRLKTAQESTGEKDAALQEYLESVGGKVAKAIVTVGLDKGLWTMAELRAKYRNF